MLGETNRLTLIPRITLRLSDDELSKLNELTASEHRGLENRTELLRLLIAREFNRSKGLAKEWQSAFRIGRPTAKIKTCLTKQKKSPES
jgi:hypothetical protein